MVVGWSHVRCWLLASLVLLAHDALCATGYPAWLVSLGVTLGGSPTAASISELAVDSRSDSVIVGTLGTGHYPGIDATRIANAGLGMRFVARLDRTGAQRHLSLVGAPSGAGVPVGDDRFTGLALDGADNAYVVAYDVALDVPTGATYRGAAGRPYVFRVSPLGQVTRFATALDPAIRSVNALAVDGSGNVFAVGSADAGLRTTAGATYPASAVAPQCVAPYVIKLTAGGTATAYATYLANAGTQGDACGDALAGSSMQPAAYAITVDRSGNAWITGQAEPGARALGGGIDLAPKTATLHAYGRSAASHAFITRLDGSGTVTWSARLGGAQRDRGTSILVDGAGNVVVGGKTTSDGSFPALGAALFDPFQVYGCALNTPEFGFIAKLSPDGTRIAWSGLLPGDGTSIDDCNSTGALAPTLLAADGTGGVYAAGFNTTNHYAAMSRNNPMAADGDAFFAQIDGTGAIRYSTWMTVRAPAQGIGVDREGNVRIAGGAFLRQLSPARLPAEVAPRREPVCTGAAVDLDARIAAAGDIGSVDFLIDGALAGTAALQAGVATLAASLPAGVHRIQVRYRGGAALDGASSTPTYLAVQQAGLC